MTAAWPITDDSCVNTLTLSDFNTDSDKDLLSLTKDVDFKRIFDIKNSVI